MAKTRISPLFDSKTISFNIIQFGDRHRKLSLDFKFIDDFGQDFDFSREDWSMTVELQYRKKKSSHF